MRNQSPEVKVLWRKVTEMERGSGSDNHAALSNLAYAASGHTGFEPTVAKGNLTTSTTGLAVTGGTGAVIGAGATVNADTGYGMPTTTKMGNWDTSYGWGDHAGLYDPVGTAAGAVSSHNSSHDHSKLHDPVTAGTGISVTGQQVNNSDTGSGAVTTHESTYDHSKLHDAVTILDTDTVDLSLSTQQISAAVRLQMSLTSDASGVKLSGDAATPGNSKYYGTDGSGTKGFHDLPAAGAGDVTGPETNTANYVPQWNGANSKALKDGLAVGTAASNLVQLDGSAKLPAVDGSQLTNLPSGGGATWLEVQVFS